MALNSTATGACTRAARAAHGSYSAAICSSHPRSSSRTRRVYAGLRRTIRRMGLSIAAWAVAVIGLALLGAAGPAYRLGASLRIAFAIVQWAAVIALGGAALSSGALWWS